MSSTRSGTGPLQISQDPLDYANYVKEELVTNPICYWIALYCLNTWLVTAYDDKKSRSIQ